MEKYGFTKWYKGFTHGHVEFMLGAKGLEGDHNEKSAPSHFDWNIDAFDRLRGK